MPLYSGDLWRADLLGDDCHGWINVKYGDDKGPVSFKFASKSCTHWDIEDPDEGPTTWEWTNSDEPKWNLTLTPSIGWFDDDAPDGYRLHGWVEDGEWRDA